MSCKVLSTALFTVIISGGWVIGSSMTAYAAVDGYTEIHDLTAQYTDARSDCGSASKPAFLCSGIMLRGTFPSEDYDSWNPSPDSVKSGGVSFSYLRQDVKFGKLAYGYLNGMIFFPIFDTPDELNDDIDVLCYFPKDSASANRDEHGCGRHSSYPVESRPCDEHAPPIVSGDEWVSHYQTPGITNRNQHQCGFNVSDNENEMSATRFYSGIVARNKLQIQTGYISQQNEFRLATWGQGLHNELPIQAFFYLKNSTLEGQARPEDDPEWHGRTYTKDIPAGLAGAQHDQKVMYQRSRRFIPIISIYLPQSASENAKFTYYDADQVIPY